MCKGGSECRCRRGPEGCVSHVAKDRPAVLVPKVVRRQRYPHRRAEPRLPGARRGRSPEHRAHAGSNGGDRQAARRRLVGRSRRGRKESRLRAARLRVSTCAIQMPSTGGCCPWPWSRNRPVWRGGRLAACVCGVRPGGDQAAPVYREGEYPRNGRTSSPNRQSSSHPPNRRRGWPPHGPSHHRPRTWCSCSPATL